LALQAVNQELQSQLDETRQRASALRHRGTDGDRPSRSRTTV
jgi:hypothetical protein